MAKVAGEDEPSSALEVKAGLCDRCRYQRIVSTTRGSSFSLCEKSKEDERFPKYPRIPVVACVGYSPR